MPPAETTPSPSPTTAERVPVPTSTALAPKAETQSKRVEVTELIGGHTRASGNQRRSAAGQGKLLAIMCGVIVSCLAVSIWMLRSFHREEIQAPIAQLQATVAQLKVPHELASQVTTAQQAELEATKVALGKANQQILTLQRQLDALRSTQEQETDRLNRIATQIQTAAVSSSDNAKPTTGAQVASMVPVSSPVTQELWLLKERNRLVTWADEAIVQGHSEAYKDLWRGLDDPDMARLRDGVQAEIIRVQKHYHQFSALPPDYRLPISELFKDKPLAHEADLSADEVIKLLLDLKQPMEVRARAAYVLGGQRKLEVARALVQAVRDDPALGVVKEAQRTLTEDYDLTAPTLHLRAIDAWWKDYSAAQEKAATTTPPTN